MAINGSASYPPAGGGGAPTITFGSDTNVSSSVPGATFSIIAGTLQYSSLFTLFGRPVLAGFSTVDLSQMDDDDAYYLFNDNGVINSPDLVHLIFPSSNTFNQQYIGLNFSGCGLNASSVDGFFNYVVACFNITSFTNGTFDISGGTNAAPTTASLAARTTLIAAGNMLITN